MTTTKIRVHCWLQTSQQLISTGFKLSFWKELMNPSSLFLFPSISPSVSNQRRFHSTGIHSSLPKYWSQEFHPSLSNILLQLRVKLILKLCNFWKQRLNASFNTYHKGKEPGRPSWGLSMSLPWDCFLSSDCPLSFQHWPSLMPTKLCNSLGLSPRHPPLLCPRSLF
jgi:hypothetical protein